MSNAQNSKNNRRQLFLFQPAKILEEKEGGVQFPNPQIGPDSLCVHQATLLNQRPRISNGSQSRRSKIASAAPSVGKSFSNLELQRTNRIEWAWPLETNLSHFYILHKKKMILAVDQALLGLTLLSSFWVVLFLEDFLISLNFLFVGVDTSA